MNNGKKLKGFNNAAIMLTMDDPDFSKMILFNYIELENEAPLI